MEKLITIIAILFLNTLIAQEAHKDVFNRVSKRNEINTSSQSAVPKTEPLTIKKCVDFKVTGLGDNIEWNKAGWNNLTKLDSGGTDYSGKFKMLYSINGIYILFSGKDDKITTKNYENFEAIFNGDV